MRKYFVPIIALLFVGILSYMYNLMSFFLLAVIALSLIVVLMAGIVRLFRSSLSTRWLKVPFTIMAIAVIGILTGLLRPSEQATLHTGNVSEKLAYAYKTDQADRMTIKTYLGKDNLAMRDSIRLRQVIQLYKDNQIRLPIDKFHAAFVLHHSKQSSYYEMAQQLAREAAAVNDLKDNFTVQWLAKATYDRWLISLGKAQKYGTQDKVSFSLE